MIIIADSSALIALATCDALSLLDQLYSTVKVPRTVFEEVTTVGKQEAEILQGYLGGKVKDIDLTQYLITAVHLGRGELEAMALYKALHANKLLVDDRDARKVAELNDINVIGSLGILLMAKKKGLISEINPRIQALQNSDIYISDSLFSRILNAANEN